MHNIHQASTLTPPTEKQFKSIIEFLLLPDPDYTTIPLPIQITVENKWRWHHSIGRIHYNIFKYPSEVPWIEYRYGCHDYEGIRNWPENHEYEVIELEKIKKESGEPFDEALIAEMWSRIKRTITPTSPFWEEVEEDIVQMEPDKKKQGRPPYFFDP